MSWHRQKGDLAAPNGEGGEAVQIYAEHARICNCGIFCTFSQKVATPPVGGMKCRCIKDFTIQRPPVTPPVTPPVNLPSDLPSEVLKRIEC